jgi:hypothetical protein
VRLYQRLGFVTVREIVNNGHVAKVIVKLAFEEQADLKMTEA